MKESRKGMLIVLETEDSESVKIPSSFSRKLVAALRNQPLVVDEIEPLSHRLDRWMPSIGLQNRRLTLLIISILLISSLMFGLASALQISQVEGSGGSIFDVIRGLLLPRGPEDARELIVGQGTPTPESTLESYGAGFGWPDRFNNVEVLRETESSKVLWPISTLISVLILGAWLVPRSDR